MMMMSHVLLNIERLIVVLLTAIAFLLALVSFRGLVPVPDPLTPVGYIDRLSLLFGLHEQSHVVIVSSHHWTTEVHTFTFQRRLKDGAFYMTEERKESLPFGITDQLSEEGVRRKCREILKACENNLPFTASRQKTPIMFGLPGLAKLETEDKRTLVSGLHHCLDSSMFDYSKEGSIGKIKNNQKALVISQISVQVWFHHHFKTQCNGLL